MPEDSDFYDSGAAPEGGEQTKPEDKNQPGEKKEGEATTALLPKSLFPGEPPAIGDVCQFKVEHLWENEVEVSYAKEGEEKPRSSMDNANDAFDKMAAPTPTAQ